MQTLVRIILPVALVMFLLDRASKWWVIEGMDLEHARIIEVWPGVVNFVMAWNDGINFGLFGGGAEGTRWILVGLAVVISIALGTWAAWRGDRAIAWGAGLVIGGALGNAWDRVSHWGAVADFLNVTCCGIENPFSFNLADIAIFAGAVWMAVRA